jgi:hypothetical protein
VSVPIRQVDPALAQPQSRQISRLMWFFALVYVVEGLGQTGGLIAQPLNYFFKAGLRLDPGPGDRVSDRP